MQPRRPSVQISVIAVAALVLCALVSFAVVATQRGELPGGERLLQTVARIAGNGGRLMMLNDDAPAGPESLNKYLRASADSIAYSCGGKEVADVCLLSTETCVASMQKKSQYTTEQSVARDMGTCSCFQENGCSPGCNAAMQSMFGGYISVADCPVSTSPFVYAGSNPYDVYGASAFDSAYNDPSFMYSTAGAVYKADPRKQMLAQVPADEPVMLVSRAMKMRAGRKI